MTHELHLPDVDATRALGAALGARLTQGAVILLHGGLGAGKTALAQGIARGLGIVGTVQSPTFVLIAEYPEARVPLRHVDLYRIDTPAEVDRLDLAERVGVEGAWVIEWPERAAETIWPVDRLEVRITPEGQGRRASLRAGGPEHARLLAAIAGRAESR